MSRGGATDVYTSSMIMYVAELSPRERRPPRHACTTCSPLVMYAVCLDLVLLTFSWRLATVRRGVGTL